MSEGLSTILSPQIIVRVGCRCPKLPHTTIRLLSKIPLGVSAQYSSLKRTYKSVQIIIDYIYLERERDEGKKRNEKECKELINSC